MKDIETLNYLEELRVLGSNYGLQRTERLLELMGNPHKKLKFIHIAGTNGKGSTSEILGSILKEHGYKIGTFNSPHLEEIEETIRINNKNIKEEDFVNLIREIKPFINKVIEEGFNHPTEFEVLTCVMFCYLYNQKVDFGIIEVGLGGRLDSTNVLSPILSIITSVSIDHTNILGNTIEEITTEKSGIIKEGIPVITCNQKQEVMKIIKNQVELKNSRCINSDSENYKLIDIISGEVPYQKISFGYKEYYYDFFDKNSLVKGDDLTKEDGKINLIKEHNLILDFPLLGKHQIINLSLAIKALEILEELSYIKIDITSLKRGVKSVKWKGRLEVLRSNPYIVIDGAHNISGVGFLKNNIVEYFKYKNIYLVLGILADKDVEEMVKIITPMATEIYTVTAKSKRAKEAEELREIVLKYNKNCIAFNEYKDAINLALSKANSDDLIIASGSLYMIGELRKVIKNL